MSTTSDSSSGGVEVGRGDESLQPVAAVLALVLPGLGHWYLGEKARARRIFAGVMGLFLFGVLIGGVDVVDRKEDSVWFAGQALVGPIAFGFDWVNQNMLKAHPLDSSGNPLVTEQRELAPARSLYPGEVVERRDVRTASGTRTIRVAAPAPAGVDVPRPPGTKSLGRVNELGTLFATIAGMLNLIVVIDAGFHRSRRR